MGHQIKFWEWQKVDGIFTELWLIQRELFGTLELRGMGLWWAVRLIDDIITKSCKRPKIKRIFKPKFFVEIIAPWLESWRVEAKKECLIQIIKKTTSKMLKKPWNRVDIHGQGEHNKNTCELGSVSIGLKYLCNYRWTVNIDCVISNLWLWFVTLQLLRMLPSIGRLWTWW